jgi:hypothetical protein
MLNRIAAFVLKAQGLRRCCLLVLVAVVSVTGVASFASTQYSVTTGGIWAGNAPTTAESAPGESWSISFQVVSNPTPYFYANTIETFVPISDFVLDLNGSPVYSSSSSSVYLYPDANGAGFEFEFPDSDIFFVDTTDQIYSGTESSPTIAPGTYSSPAEGSDLNYGPDGDASYDFSSNSIVVSAIPAGPTPEPSGFLLLGTGFAFLAWFGVRRMI